MKRVLAITNAVSTFNYVVAIDPYIHAQLTNCTFNVELTIYFDDDADAVELMMMRLEEVVVASATIEKHFISKEKRSTGGDDLHYLTITWEIDK